MITTNILEFLKLIDLKEIELKRKNGTKHKYYNCAMSFDIETSSFYIDENHKISTSKDTDLQKISNMYIWMLAYNEHIIYGRYWIDFIALISKLALKFGTNENKRLVIYVHNLSYEFQYIYKFFDWIQVFATDKRKPIYAVTNKGIEFRCSYMLSGYNLDTVAKNLHTKKIEKLKGNLDYNLIRHNETPLSNTELEYCFNDVLIVTQYINEQIAEHDNDITLLPYTNTGRVRNYVRPLCLKDDVLIKGKPYKYFIKEFTIDSHEYKLLNLCYAGGFTHSNAYNTDVKINDVSSYDFTSSYPAVMLTEKYPMSKGQLVSIRSKEMLNNFLKNYCCLFTIQLTGVTPKICNDNILSKSKCFNVENGIFNNGRIVSCDSLTTVVNEIDFANINDFYNYESIIIGDFYVYEKDYLPKPIIEAILTLYNDKTLLKGVPGKEKEYLNAKGMLNSIYGMCVTNTMKEDCIFENNEWLDNPNYNLNDKIERYNTDRNRFLNYHWGVWVTSYARRNLFTGIKETKADYIYSDTDSIKITNKDKYTSYFNQYNEEIKNKLRLMCEHYQLDFELCRPHNKLIGIWDYEGTYKAFKTLGAKRYMIEKQDGSHEITVAGLSKKAVSYIEEIAENQDIDVFEVFQDLLYIPKEHTYKNTHTYIDREYLVTIIDYLGNEKEVLCKSGVHLEATDFNLSMTKMYLDYLINMKRII